MGISAFFLQDHTNPCKHHASASLKPGFEEWLYLSGYALPWPSHPACKFHRDCFQDQNTSSDIQIRWTQCTIQIATIMLWTNMETAKWYCLDTDVHEALSCGTWALILKAIDVWIHLWELSSCCCCHSQPNADVATIFDLASHMRVIPMYEHTHFFGTQFVNMKNTTESTEYVSICQSLHNMAVNLMELNHQEQVVPIPP